MKIKLRQRHKPHMDYGEKQFLKQIILNEFAPIISGLPVHLAWRTISSRYVIHQLDFFEALRELDLVETLTDKEKESFKDIDESNLAWRVKVYKD